MEHPLLKQAQIIALHQLKAAIEVRLDPAADIAQPIRQGSPTLLNSAIDRDRIAILESFDHHKQHTASAAFLNTGAILERAAAADPHPLPGGRPHAGSAPHRHAAHPDVLERQAWSGIRQPSTTASARAWLRRSPRSATAQRAAEGRP